MLNLLIEVVFSLSFTSQFVRIGMREWILGGATRTVLDYMEVPVLMAH